MVWRKRSTGERQIKISAKKNLQWTSGCFFRVCRISSMFICGTWITSVSNKWSPFSLLSLFSLSLFFVSSSLYLSAIFRLFICYNDFTHTFSTREADTIQKICLYLGKKKLSSFRILSPLQRFLMVIRLVSISNLLLFTFCRFIPPSSVQKKNTVEIRCFW